jgi:ATP-dependent Lon protease
MAVVPVYRMITLPDSNIYLQTDLYKNMTGRSPIEGEKVTIIISKKETARKDLGSESFYPIGVSGRIIEISDQGYVLVHLSTRVNLDEIYFYPDNTIELTVSRREEINDLDEQEAMAKLAAIKHELSSFSKGFEWGEALRNYIQSWNTIGDIGAGMSPWMSESNEERYALLAEDSKKLRFEKLEAMIYQNLELLRVRLKAQSVQHQNNQKLYHEQAIRKQISYLQKELDELHPEELDDIRKLELKIENAGMNETALKEARKLMNRLKAEGTDGHESGLIMDYLEFASSLPWKKEPLKEIDLSEAEAILDADHFGLEKVKRRILEQIAVMRLKKKQSGSILLFVGAPGTGKTSIGQSIAKALGREYVRVSLGGIHDEADIRGHRRTYIGAMPGRIMDGIHKAGVSNPVMVLDEVDKLSASFNGDPASALLEALDPEQNFSFTDHYMNVPFDLSDVLFICTANTIDTIPEPLFNRMEMIRFQGYTPIEKKEIAIQHLLPKALESAGLGKEDLILENGVIEQIIDEYTREAGVRGLKKRIDTLCRSAAIQLVKGTASPIEVKKEQLREYLDMSPIHQKLVKDSAEPGVVTGLAWTEVGGDVLYIETMKTNGSGKLTITGQLGDVMKESAQIAISLVKSMYPEQAAQLEHQDLHIHVPDGATPKDGPSAGITLTTALASLVSGISVSPAIAMTGEVSLQGNVNPIGGLPEKLMAAQRSGVQKVFIPADNVDDLNDVAEEVKDQLTIIPVHTVSEVLHKLSLE